MDATSQITLREAADRLDLSLDRIRQWCHRWIDPDWPGAPGHAGYLSPRNVTELLLLREAHRIGIPHAEIPRVLGELRKDKATDPTHPENLEDTLVLTYWAGPLPAGRSERFGLLYARKNSQQSLEEAVRAELAEHVLPLMDLSAGSGALHIIHLSQLHREVRSTFPTVDPQDH